VGLEPTLMQVLLFRCACDDEDKSEKTSEYIYTMFRRLRTFLSKRGRFLSTSRSQTCYGRFSVVCENQRYVCIVRVYVSRLNCFAAAKRIRVASLSLTMAHRLFAVCL
jgi:hypothetical protein